MEEERRRDPTDPAGSRRTYTRAQFTKFHGAARGARLWRGAGAAPERRRDPTAPRSRRAYARDEFLAFYGARRGAQVWKAAGDAAGSPSGGAVRAYRKGDMVWWLSHRSERVRRCKVLEVEPKRIKIRFSQNEQVYPPNWYPSVPGYWERVDGHTDDGVEDWVETDSVRLLHDAKAAAKRAAKERAGDVDALEKRRRLTAEAAEQLRALPPGAGTVEVLTADAEREAVELMTRSFGGTAETERPELGNDWVLGPEMRGRWDDPRRQRAVRHGMRWCFLWAVHHGGLPLGVRLDGKLGAVCLVHHPEGIGPGHPDLGAGPIDLGDKDGGLGALAQKRAEWFWGGKNNLLARLHEESVKGPHWYVQIMAVDPSAQGKGLCARALRALSFLADRRGAPCYLDTCGELNRKVYGRCGYETPAGMGGRGYELNMPGDPHPIRDPSLPPPAEVCTQTPDIIRHFGLVRPARAPDLPSGPQSPKC